MPDKNKPERDPAGATSLTFDYIKSQFFRVIHADGVLGGGGPRRNIQLNFFNERLPIPQREVYSLTKEHKLGAEQTEYRVARAGVVREVEVGVVMELPVAKELLKWLTVAIQSVEAMEKKRKEKHGSKESGSAS